MKKETATHSRIEGFPGGSDSKESACNVGDSGLISGWGRSPGGGNGNTLQDSGLDNPHRGAWWATTHGVAEADTTERLSAAQPLPVFLLFSTLRLSLLSFTEF